MTIKTLAIFLALILAAVPTKTHAKISTIEFDRHASDGRVEPAPHDAVTRGRRIKDRPPIPQNYASHEPQVVGHPAGCPSRAFCGCGASVEVFGRSVRDLWPARAWYRFPRTSPAPGMVAVRSHHVFVIRQVLSGGNVLAFDANSGGRQTRIHVRSLAGYTVVNPSGSRYASAQ